MRCHLELSEGLMVLTLAPLIPFNVFIIDDFLKCICTQMGKKITGELTIDKFSDVELAESDFTVQ